MVGAELVPGGSEGLKDLLVRRQPAWKRRQRIGRIDLQLA